MSKYHPLDVRHPSNRHRERNTYLLDPPNASTYDLRAVTTTEQAPSRRRADYRATTDSPSGNAVSSASDTPIARAASRVSAAATASSPWGGSTDSSPAPNTTNPIARSRSASWIPKVFFFAVFTYVVLRNFDIWDDITLFIRRTAFELGL